MYKKEIIINTNVFQTQHAQRFYGSYTC